MNKITNIRHTVIISLPEPSPYRGGGVYVSQFFRGFFLFCGRTYLNYCAIFLSYLLILYYSFYFIALLPFLPADGVTGSFRRVHKVREEAYGAFDSAVCHHGDKQLPVSLMCQLHGMLTHPPTILSHSTGLR